MAEHYRVTQIDSEFVEVSTDEREPGVRILSGRVLIRRGLVDVLSQVVQVDAIGQEQTLSRPRFPKYSSAEDRLMRVLNVTGEARFSWGWVQEGARSLQIGIYDPGASRTARRLARVAGEIAILAAGLTFLALFLVLPTVLPSAAALALTCVAGVMCWSAVRPLERALIKRGRVRIQTWKGEHCDDGWFTAVDLIHDTGSYTNRGPRRPSAGSVRRALLNAYATFEHDADTAVP